MTTTDSTARADRRATVRQLADRGMSARAIGAVLGVGKDTVRRDLLELEAEVQSGARQDEPAAPSDARQEEPLELPGARQDATTEATGAPVAPLAPAGASLTIPVDEDLGEDLAVLLLAGHTLTEAVGRAVELLADAYRTAWDYGECPRGERPRVWCTTRPPYAAPPAADGSRG